MLINKLSINNLLKVKSLKLNCNLHNLNVVKLNKTLLNLKGQDTYQFLQGLITNDLRQFLLNFNSSISSNIQATTNQSINSVTNDKTKLSIFSLLLQTNGRTFADLILYNVGKLTEYNSKLNNRNSQLEINGDKDHSIILECDSNIKTNLLRLLKIYKLKKDIELNELNNKSIWCIYSPDLIDLNLDNYKDNNLLLNKDPRLNELGFRCLSDENEFLKFKNKLIQLNLIDENKFKLNEVKPIDYQLHRFRLGVNEGILDNPSGQCLPLEDNGDLLNGIDFNKGCYLGQELVARQHYTGVIRKRLMPIEIIKFNNKNLDLDNVEMNLDLKEKVKFGIQLTKEDNLKKRLGKIRSISKNLGLGIFYLNELESCNYLASNKELGLLIKVKKPIFFNKII